MPPNERNSSKPPENVLFSPRNEIDLKEVRLKFLILIDKICHRSVGYAGVRFHLTRSAQAHACACALLCFFWLLMSDT